MYLLFKKDQVPFNVSKQTNLNPSSLKVTSQKYPQRGLIFPPEDSSNQIEDQQEQKTQTTDSKRITRHLMRLQFHLGDSNQILFSPN